MYTCVYVYMYACIHVCMCACVNMDIYVVSSVMHADFSGAAADFAAENFASAAHSKKNTFYRDREHIL